MENVSIYLVEIKLIPKNGGKFFNIYTLRLYH